MIVRRTTRQRESEIVMTTGPEEDLPDHRHVVAALAHLGHPGVVMTIIVATETITTATVAATTSVDTANIAIDASSLFSVYNQI